MTQEKKYEKKYGQEQIITLSTGDVLAVQKVTSKRLTDGKEFANLNICVGYQTTRGFRENKFSSKITLNGDVTEKDMAELISIMQNVKQN